MEYGFPSARDLKLEICEGLAGETAPLSKKLVEYKYSLDKLFTFREELADSNLPSVDHFLERRPDHLYSGKAAIAAALIPKEDPESLRPAKRERWYEYLFEVMMERVRSREYFSDNKLSVLTFNYDRSLEFFLFQALKSTFGCSSDEAVKTLQGIPIVHLYGSLGEFPEPARNLPLPEFRGRGYAPQYTKEQLYRAAEMILVPHEKEDRKIYEDEAFQKAYDILDFAKVLFFLGFGYHSNALKRLNPRKMNYISMICGTAQGIGEARRQDVLETFDGKIQLEDKDILSFLKNSLQFNQITKKIK